MTLLVCALGIPSAILLLMWAIETRQERRRSKMLQEYYKLMRDWRKIQDNKSTK